MGTLCFVELNRLSEKQQLKVFYPDVGQGDATLIEAEGAIIIIDGGPNSGFFDELMKRLNSLQRADAVLGLLIRTTLDINPIIVSHFDLDHYQGLNKVVAPDKFNVRKIYHNGLPRYGDNAQKDLNLGSVIHHADGTRSINTDFRGIDSARQLVSSGLLLTDKGNDNKFSTFQCSL